MTADENNLTDADRHYRDWMTRALHQAAEHFELTIEGPVVFGWLDRSAGAPASASSGRVWLRVVSELPAWVGGPAWTGNYDANVVSGLPKPRVLDLHDWPDDTFRHVRGEVLTRLPGTPCSTTNTPPPHLILPPQWWRELRASLTTLARTQTERMHSDQAKINRRIRDAFGDGTTVVIQRWETVHGDLHWGNLLRDPFGILDWELWGTGPAGTDAATLYAYSLAQPAVAATVRSQFTDVLDTPDGRRAQLAVAARLLHRASFGDHPELVDPLRRLGQRLSLEEG
ncbi:phosphotransferase [Amycolatopsis nigrescens]|uniref:phosphotransferase n=1 Tax=Amycolatopsis nigrescens TaxID=381445 RepID=UPI00035DE951|nr:phosphotransferase [Amycolatopsis nigrescens]